MIVTVGLDGPAGAVTVVPSAVEPSENVQCAAMTSKRWPPTARAVRTTSPFVLVLVDGRRQRRVDLHGLRPAVGVAEVVGDARLHAVGARARERVREAGLVGARLDGAVAEVPG